MIKYRKTNRSILWSLLLIPILLVPGFAGDKLSESVPDVPPDAVSPQDPLFHEAVSRGINLTFNDRYRESLQIFDSLIAAHPDHPAPYFFKAAAYQNWMSSYRFNEFQEEVEKNVEKAITNGNALLENRHDAWMHFYIGAAYGYRGFNRFRKHNYIGAYKDAKKGIENFQAALDTDPRLYDVYLGLGSYHYWRTARSSFIRIIAFWMSDKRELGLRQLRFAIDHGRYADNEAAYVLMAAYFDHEKYDESFSVLQEMIDKKSRPNITDLYFKGRLMVQRQNWPEVEAAFREILSRIENHEYPSIGYQVECKYWIARAMNEQGRPREALLLAREALQQSKDRNPDIELEGHLEGFDDIKKWLEDFHESLNAKLLEERP